MTPCLFLAVLRMIPDEFVLHFASLKICKMNRNRGSAKGVLVLKCHWAIATGDDSWNLPVQLWYPRTVAAKNGGQNYSASPKKLAQNEGLGGGFKHCLFSPGSLGK